MILMSLQCDSAILVFYRFRTFVWSWVYYVSVTEEIDNQYLYWDLESVTGQTHSSCIVLTNLCLCLFRSDDMHRGI